MEQKEIEKWEYTSLYKPDPQLLNDYGRKGWEAYAATEFVSKYGVSTIIYLKRRVQKGGAE